jgi:hypothetical protein
LEKNTKELGSATTVTSTSSEKIVASNDINAGQGEKTTQKLGTLNTTGQQQINALKTNSQDLLKAADNLGGGLGGSGGGNSGGNLFKKFSNWMHRGKSIESDLTGAENIGSDIGKAGSLAGEAEGAVGDVSKAGGLLSKFGNLGGIASKLGGIGGIAGDAEGLVGGLGSLGGGIGMVADAIPGVGEVAMALQAGMLLKDHWRGLVHGIGDVANFFGGLFGGGGKTPLKNLFWMRNRAYGFGSAGEKAAKAHPIDKIALTGKALNVHIVGYAQAAAADAAKANEAAMKKRAGGTGVKVEVHPGAFTVNVAGSMDSATMEQVKGHVSDQFQQLRYALRAQGR